MISPTPKVYLARAGGNGEDENYALDHGVAIIGFTAYPSLAGAKDYDAVLALVKATQPDLKPRAAGNYAGQLWAFALGMKEGDIVVLPRKLTSQVALGRVKGSYKYEKVGGVMRHVRDVEWLRPDVPRTVFGQDLLHSFGAFMTVCNIARNNAEHRVVAVLNGKPDPGFTPTPGKTVKPETVAGDDDAVGLGHDLALAAHDQIVAHIQARFREHALAQLVNAVLAADGWATRLSPPGPDGGVDILAGRGPFGLDAPRLCVQVKSQNSPADVTVFRTLQGSMQSFKAEQGLLVCWGGFNKVLLNEARQGHFMVRLWDSRDLVEAIYRTYEKLPAEIQAELPLKRVWMLVQEEPDA
jgi:restriction system protein